MSDPWVIGPNVPPLTKQSLPSRPFHQKLLRSNISLFKVCMPIPDSHSINGSITTDEDVVFTAWRPDGVGHDAIERPIDLWGDGPSNHAIVDFSFESITRLLVICKKCCMRSFSLCVEDLPARGLQAREERILRIIILRIVILQLVEGFHDTGLGLGHLDLWDDFQVQKGKSGFSFGWDWFEWFENVSM